MVTKLRNLSLLYDVFVMETTVVLNNVPKSNIFVFTSLLVSKTTFIQFCLLLWLPNSIIQADSVMLEIPVVLIIFQNFFFFTSFFISIKIGLSTIFVVSMVTKFNNLS